MNYDDLTRSIITQLSDRCDDKMPTALVDLYNKCDAGRRQPLETQLESTLSRILEVFDSTYIVIDSLDECVTKADLLRWLRSVASETSANVHLLLTSRPEPDIEYGLAALANLQKISIGDQSTMNDISVYLDARLHAAEMDKWREPEKQQIRRALLDGSGGM